MLGGHSALPGSGTAQRHSGRSGSCSLKQLASKTKLLMPTFFSNFGSSHIDFILTRRGLADKVARMADPWRCGLHAWRGGGYQIPVIASIRSRLFMQAPMTRTPRIKKNALHDAWKANTPAFQTMRAEVEELTQSGPCDAASSNAGLHSIALKHFPAHKPAQALATKAWQDPGLQQGIRACGSCVSKPFSASKPMPQASKLFFMPSGA